MIIRYFIIAIVACTGFILSAYIRKKRVKNEKLVCFLGEDCNKVVNSRYATTLGIANETMGMFYYGLVTLSFAWFSLVPITNNALLNFGFIVISGSAALFSVYLISLQVFILKEWCEWCLASSILSIAIFFLIL